MSAEAIGMDIGGELNTPRPVSARGRRPSPFALGLGRTAVESVPAMAKAATQSGTRNGGKPTQAQMEARAQQRIEDDELIREAQKGQRASCDALGRRHDKPGPRAALHMPGTQNDT